VGFSNHGNESEGVSVVTLYEPDDRWSLWKRRPRSKDNIIMAVKAYDEAYTGFICLDVWTGCEIL